MKIARRDEGNIEVFEIQGKVTGDDALKLKKAINDWLAGLEEPETRKIPMLIMHLNTVPMMDSSGFGVLVSSYTLIQKRNGKFVLVNPCESLRRQMSINTLIKIFDIYDTEEEAINAL